MNKILKLLTLSFCLLCCNRNKDINIIGLYKIDKYVVLNKENNVKDYQYLELNQDGGFKVFQSKTDTINQIKGNWRLSNKSKDNKLLVQFMYYGKITEGSLKGNIFYFIHPNDFHNNKYQMVLYVKILK